ncbi:cytochrome c oxidase accessory protein CcoG [Vibrio sp.]|nr:cytochrome c oxidase accessory protein CcoG [Vibrio sp.]
MNKDDKDKIDIKDITPKTYHPSAQDKAIKNNHIYVRESKGFFQKMRQYGAWFLLALFALTPWINYNDRQAVLIDVETQQFFLFDATFYPQDLTLLASLFVIAAFALFFVTTFLGRVWCGFLCPQTVWTFMFIWFEEKLEGKANKRRKQDQTKLTPSLIWKKTLKHVAWITISLLTGLIFIGYFVPIRSLFVDFFALDSSFIITAWVLFFAACTYGNAGWMRSIMCVHMCPYSRFQSAMFDKDTFIVGYDVKRGEKRGPRTRKADPKVLGLGDCVDCDLCVQVCPTGIDIREGLQYECISCGACIDACNHTMDKMGYKKGLISYTTEHQLEGKQTKITRPKLLGYGVMCLVMIAVFFTQVNAVDPAGLSVIRDRNQLSRINTSGEVENTYTLKVINKTQQPQTYTLRVEGIENISWYGKQTIVVQPGEIRNRPISLGINEERLSTSVTKINFILEDTEGFSITIESRFIKPL